MWNHKDTTRQTGVHPSWNRRGARAIKKMPRSHLSRRGRGGQFGETFRVSDHPVCAASEGDLFLYGAATPPVPGGEHPLPDASYLSRLKEAIIGRMRPDSAIAIVGELRRHG